MSFAELLLLAVSLAMDAFAVAICGSMVIKPERRTRGAFRFGIWFGFFQFLMPVVGYFAAVSFSQYIVDYDHWIAFLLLGHLGGNMISEAFKGKEVKNSYTPKEMAVLAFATSVDALAVGISFACLHVNIWMSSLLIGIVTFVIAGFGGLAGFRLGTAVGAKANVCGGLVLICIGTKILLEHTGVLDTVLGML